MPVPFLDDDPGYLGWIRRHPGGFVINCARSPRPDYVVLHRADCWTISGQPSRGKFWTRDLQKICGITRAELDVWAWDAVDVYPTRCGHCHP